LRVFLSYAREDRHAVLALYERLKADGFQPWMDKKDLLPGQKWEIEIPRQVHASDVVIVCLSSVFAKKAGYGQKEIALVLDTAESQPEHSIFVIPLRLEECDVPERLHHWQWGNLFEDDGYDLLLRALRHRAEQLDIPLQPLSTPAPVQQTDIPLPPVKQATHTNGEIGASIPPSDISPHPVACTANSHPLPSSSANAPATAGKANRDASSPPLSAVAGRTNSDTFSPTVSEECSIQAEPHINHSEQHPLSDLPVQTPQTHALFPVTIDEWQHELLQRNELFGKPPGYWCYVCAGEYVIGGWKQNDPVETITLPGFWIAKYPITVQQYAWFMQAGGYTTASYWTPQGWQWCNDEERMQPDYWQHAQFNSTASQPVVGISWYEATAFAAWLTAQLAEWLPAGYHFRLPTEAEWEAAAAFDAESNCLIYPWGKQPPDATRADFDKDWKSDRPAAVGEHPPGAAACGAENMVGSIWEATSSRGSGYPFQSAIVVADFAPDDRDVPWRGGAWGNDEKYVCCAARYAHKPIIANYYGGGFRLVLAS
jgi:formylglycine-generating enzyme required for sulfatase activity